MAARIAAKVHRWLGLLMAVQILFWFGSGLFFALAPIERVRSEHRIAEPRGPSISLDVAASGLDRLRGRNIVADRIELRMIGDRAVVLVEVRNARPRLYELEQGQLISPIEPALAAAIAESDHEGEWRAVRVRAVTAHTTEYRGTLPAWRVDFDDGANRSIYVAADTGLVTARRSDLWRAYDFLWGLHIMDYRHHEDFNTLILAVATFLALALSIAGIVLIPGRLGWRRRRTG